MIIIGERINGTRKNIKEAIEKKDKNFIKKEIELQLKYGADYIDLNAGTGTGDEKENLLWLVNIAQEYPNIFLSIDSSNPELIKEVLKYVKNKDVIINSINGEKEKIDKFLSFLPDFNFVKIIALTMDDKGIPSDVERRIEIAENLINILKSVGIKEENIFIDPLVQPVSVDIKNSTIFFESIKIIKKNFSPVKTTAGLSNVSFGLPNRKLINKYFLAISIFSGLDSAILDVVDEGMREAICISNLLTEKDEYCMNYIRKYRENKF